MEKNTLTLDDLFSFQTVLYFAITLGVLILLLAMLL